MTHGRPSRLVTPSGHDAVVAVPHLPVSIVFTADHRRTNVFVSGHAMRKLAALTETAR